MTDGDSVENCNPDKGVPNLTLKLPKQASLISRDPKRIDDSAKKIPHACGGDEAPVIARRPRRGTVSIGQVSALSVPKKEEPNFSSSLRQTVSASNIIGSPTTEAERIEADNNNDIKKRLSMVRVKLLEGKDVIAGKSWKNADCSELRVRTGDGLEVADIDAAGWAFVTLVSRWDKPRLERKHSTRHFQLNAPLISVSAMNYDASAEKKPSSHGRHHHTHSTMRSSSVDRRSEVSRDSSFKSSEQQSDRNGLGDSTHRGDGTERGASSDRSHHHHRHRGDSIDRSNCGDSTDRSHRGMIGRNRCESFDLSSEPASERGDRSNRSSHSGSSDHHQHNHRDGTTHRSLGMRGWVNLNVICPAAVEKLRTAKPELKDGTILLAKNEGLKDCFPKIERSEVVQSAIDESSLTSARGQTVELLKKFLPNRPTTVELLERGVLLNQFSMMGAYESSKKLWQKNTSSQLADIVSRLPSMKSQVLASPLSKSESWANIRTALRNSRKPQSSHKVTMSSDRFREQAFQKAFRERMEQVAAEEKAAKLKEAASSPEGDPSVTNAEKKEEKEEEKKEDEDKKNEIDESKKEEENKEEDEEDDDDIDDIDDIEDSFTEEQLKKVVTIFNESAKKGIEEMKRIGLLNDSMKPREVAELFHKTELFPGLNASVVADYLGKDFNNEILREYIKQVHFKHFSFESALRFFLSWFVLPSEAQAIGRASEAFAQHFFDSCADTELFADADSVGILSSALLILNPDLHNKSVKSKMSMKQFIPWLRGTNGGHDFSKPLLEELYTHVADCEVKTITGSFQNVIRHGWLNQRLSSIRSIRRWYVLEGTILTSSLKPTEPVRHTFDMKDATLCVGDPRKLSFHLMIKEGEISQELRLRAENEFSFLAWVDALRFVISQIDWVSSVSPLSSMITSTSMLSLGQLNRDSKQDSDLLSSGSDSNSDLLKASSRTLRLSCEVSPTALNKVRDIDLVHFSTNIDKETVLHCYTLVDTMECLRSAASVTSVVVFGSSLLVVPNGTPFDSPEKKHSGKTVTQKLNPLSFTDESIVHAIPIPFAAGSSPQGSLFYVASDGSRNVAMVFRWDSESALPVARRLEWVPISECLDPETWGHLWDGVPSFIAKALRFWLSLPDNQNVKASNSSADLLQTTFSRKMTL